MTLQRGSDFTPLTRTVRSAGLLRRRRVRYAFSIGCNFLAIAATWAGVFLLGPTWWALMLAIPAALFTVRTCFFGHDACHQQIARTKRVNYVLGLLHGNVGVGMSYGWWADKHNRHHANPNHVDKDPDVGAGALVWTPAQARRRHGWARWLARHQATMYFPLLLLEGLNLKASSIAYLVRNRDRRTELVLLAVHYVLTFSLLFLALSPFQAITFWLLLQALIGLHLGCAFAPNHKGMPMPEAGERWDYLRRQVLTSRNVRGGPVVDWMLGGLNYQIEHHLFPNMPRANLRHAQPIIRQHCAEIGIPYTEAGFVASFRIALRHMRDVGRPG